MEIPDACTVYYFECFPIELLHPLAQNKLFTDPNYYKHCPEVMRMLEDVKENGISSPLVATSNEKGHLDVHVGNRRLFVAKKLGLKHVKVIVNVHIDHEESRLSLSMKADAIPLKTLEAVRNLFPKGGAHVWVDKEHNRVYAVADDYKEWTTALEPPEEWCVHIKQCQATEK